MSKLYDLLYAMIGKLNSSVKTTAQTLTDAEKTQARTNIGAQVTGDYAEKKDIPTVPTKVSAFTNDAGYLTQHQDLSAYAKKTEIPSKLPNPHALTINGKTYDGTSAVSIKVEGGSGGAQADWKAARGLPGHVLHRTHWVDESGTVLLDDAVGFADGSALIDDVQLVAGASYIITYNGETEERVAVDDGLGSIMLRPNNLPVDFNYEAPNDEMGVSEAFRIYPHDFEESEAAIKIVLNSEIIHPLDKKFLPDDIGGGADWSASEGEPGHVLNRTHWVERGRVEVLAETTMTEENSAEVIRSLPRIGLVVGDTYIVNINGVEYTCVAEHNEELGFPITLLLTDGMPFCVAEIPTELVPEVGTNMFIDVVSESATLPVTFSIYQDGEVVHKLDPKFLPDGYPYVETKQTSLPETKLIAQDGQFYITTPVVLQAGGRYTVTWNGVAYECVGTGFEADGMEFTLVGNSANFGGNDTGEPFCLMALPVMVADGIYGIVYPLDGSAEPTMAISGEYEVVHQIHPKYVPTPDFALPKLTPFEHGMDGTLVLDGTVYSEELESNPERLAVITKAMSTGFVLFYAYLETLCGTGLDGMTSVGGTTIGLPTRIVIVGNSYFGSCTLPDGSVFRAELIDNVLYMAHKSGTAN